MSNWNNIGLTSSSDQKSWLEAYAQKHMLYNSVGFTVSGSQSTTSLSSLLPIAIKVSAQTIAQNLVSVQPMPHYNLNKIYNTSFEKIYDKNNNSYGVIINNGLLKIEFKKDSDIDFYIVKYIEKTEKERNYIYVIYFNKFISEKYQDVCEYTILEKVECDWKTYMRDKKIDGILD